jgi:predicted DNA-binding transcriptional regulator AlpA
MKSTALSSPTTTERLIRWQEVNRLTGLSRRTAVRMEQAGDFPRCRRCAGYAWTAWVLSEIEEWVRARVTLPAA